jgi:hypothetical protein
MWRAQRVRRCDTTPIEARAATVREHPGTGRRFVEPDRRSRPVATFLLIARNTNASDAPMATSDTKWWPVTITTRLVITGWSAPSARTSRCPEMRQIA